MMRRFFFCVYDEAPVETPPETGEGGDPEPKPSDPPAGDGKSKTYTEEELSKILKKERLRESEKTKKTVSELEQLKKSKSLTETEKEQLQTRITELNDSLLTKDELAKKELKKQQQKHQDELDTAKKESERWRKQYHDSMIERTIKDAAVESEAFNAEQLAALLFPKARLVEDLTEDGKPAGTYTPKVQMSDEQDGKQVTLDLTITEAVKRMKETPDKYGNLFKSTLKSGLGLGESPPPRNVDIANVSPDQYMKLREKYGPGGGLDKRK